MQRRDNLASRSTPIAANALSITNAIIHCSIPVTIPMTNIPPTLITRLAQYVLVESRVDMSSTINLSTKGWLTIGLVMCVLSAFAISIGQLVAAIAAFGTACIAVFDFTHVHLRAAFVHNPT